MSPFIFELVLECFFAPSRVEFSLVGTCLRSTGNRINLRVGESRPSLSSIVTSGWHAIKLRTCVSSQRSEIRDRRSEVRSMKLEV